MSVESYRNYILDGNKTPVPEPDIVKYSKWMDVDNNRRVAKTLVAEDVFVSTVFLGIDHAYEGPPLLFESMIFGGHADQEQERYYTWAEALAGHTLMVMRASGEG